MEAPRVEDELRPVTALFADVVGSTSLGEKLGPAEIKVLIGECVTRMTRVVEAYGGRVGAFMGDGIAAFFGIDGAREDDAIRAALAALRIVDVISEYAREIEAAWRIPSVDVRLGINSGRVATGLVGGSDPQRVALGDAVNVASRLQSHAERGGIVVGAATATQLAARFELDYLGQLEVRGRTQPTEAWRLVRYIGEPASGHLGYFVGRADELYAFGRVVSDLQLGRGQIVVVLGEPGIGKSRFLGECQARLEPPVTWLSGRCAEHRVLKPYGPFVEILRRWLDIEVDTPPVVTRVRLLARLQELLGEDASAVLPPLSRLLALDQAPSEVVITDTEPGADGVRQAYATWVSAIAQSRPLVLAIDDAERVDASTRLLTEELFRLTNAVPLVVLLAMRNEPESPGWPLLVEGIVSHSRRTIELKLDALADDEADELIALKDLDGVLTPGARCELRTRAEGNPLYLEELTRTALEAVRDSSGGAASWSEARIPTALESLLLARVDRVNKRARSVLQVAAVIGRRFPMWLLERATSSFDLAENLVLLMQEGLVQEDGLTPKRYFAFRHGLYHDAVLATLTGGRKRELHELVAGALETGEQDQLLEEIAGHYLASGNHEKAREYLERAGRRAAGLSSLTEAADLVDQARELSRYSADRSAQPRLTALAAQIARQMGLYDEANRLADEVLVVADDGNERASALLEIARTEFDLGNREAATTACRTAIQVGSDLTTRRDVLLVLASIALRANDIEETKGLLDQIGRHSTGFSPQTRMQWLSLWAGYHASAGSPNEAEPYAMEAVTLASELGDLSLELRSRRDAGLINLLQGRLRRARDLLKDVYETGLATGHVVRAQEAVCNLLGAQLHLGELQEGLTIGLEALRWVHAPVWRAATLGNVGDIEFELGIPDARDHLAECMRIAEAEQDPAPAAHGALTTSEVDLADGDFEGAVAAMNDLAENYRGTGRSDVLARAYMFLARAHLERGDIELAASNIGKARRLAPKLDCTRLPELLRVEGLTQFRLGQTEAGLEGMRESHIVARDMSMRLDEARGLIALGLAVEESRWVYFHRAREIFAECGSQRGLAEVRAAEASLQSA